MMFGCWLRPQCQEKTVWLLPGGGAKSCNHAVAHVVWPLSRLVCQDQNRREPVRPSWIASDTANTYAALAVLDPCLLRRVPRSPAVAVVPHECKQGYAQS